MTTKHLMTFDEPTLQKLVASGAPVLVELGAKWCPACRALEPILDRVAADHAARARFGTLDMDDAPGFSTRHRVRAAPTVIVFAAGREVARHVGVTSYAQLVKLLPV